MNNIIALYGIPDIGGEETRTIETATCDFNWISTITCRNFSYYAVLGSDMGYYIPSGRNEWKQKIVFSQANAIAVKNHCFYKDGIIYVYFAYRTSDSHVGFIKYLPLANTVTYTQASATTASSPECIYCDPVSMDVYMGMSSSGTFPSIVRYDVTNSTFSSYTTQNGPGQLLDVGFHKLASNVITGNFIYSYTSGMNINIDHVIVKDLLTKDWIVARSRSAAYGTEPGGAIMDYWVGTKQQFVAYMWWPNTIMMGARSYCYLNYLSGTAYSTETCNISDYTMHGALKTNGFILFIRKLTTNRIKIVMDCFNLPTGQNYVIDGGYTNEHSAVADLDLSLPPIITPEGDILFAQISSSTYFIIEAQPIIDLQFSVDQLGCGEGICKTLLNISYKKYIDLLAENKYNTHLIVLANHSLVYIGAGTIDFENPGQGYINIRTTSLAQIIAESTPQLIYSESETNVKHYLEITNQGNFKTYPQILRYLAIGGPGGGGIGHLDELNGRFYGDYMTNFQNLIDCLQFLKPDATYGKYLHIDTTGFITIESQPMNSSYIPCSTVFWPTNAEIKGTSLSVSHNLVANLRVFNGSTFDFSEKAGRSAADIHFRYLPSGTAHVNALHWSQYLVNQIEFRCPAEAISANLIIGYGLPVKITGEDYNITNMFVVGYFGGINQLLVLVVPVGAVSIMPWIVSSMNRSVEVEDFFKRRLENMTFTNDAWVLEINNKALEIRTAKDKYLYLSPQSTNANQQYTFLNCHMYPYPTSTGAGVGRRLGNSSYKYDQVYTRTGTYDMMNDIEILAKTRTDTPEHLIEDLTNHLRPMLPDRQRLPEENLPKFTGGREVEEPSLNDKTDLVLCSLIHLIKELKAKKVID